MLNKEISNAVAAKVQEIMGSDYEVFSKDVEKNNNMVLTGIVVMKKGSSIAPTVYIEDLYEQTGNNISATAERVVEALKKQSTDDISLISSQPITDSEYIRDNAYVVLVNAEKNKSMIQNTVCEEFLDLLVVVRVRINSSASYVLKKDLCEKVGIKESEILQIAKQNMKGSFEGTEPADMMRRLFGEDIADNVGIMVCTNKEGIHGAVFMLYPDLLEGIAAQKNDDLYILPSSIHECLAVPAEGQDPSELAKIVYAVNREQVAPEEFLSDSVYCYNREDGQIYKVA